MTRTIDLKTYLHCDALPKWFISNSKHPLLKDFKFEFISEDESKPILFTIDEYLIKTFISPKQSIHYISKNSLMEFILYAFDQGNETGYGLHVKTKNNKSISTRMFKSIVDGNARYNGEYFSVVLEEDDTGYYFENIDIREAKWNALGEEISPPYPSNHDLDIAFSNIEFYDVTQWVGNPIDNALTLL